MASPLTGVSDAWSRVAEGYQRYIVPDFLPAARELCESTGIRGGDAVLDVACGPGTVTFVAAELGAAPVVGVDFARNMVSLAHRGRRPGSATHFVAGDACLLPFAGERFDAVVSSFGLIFAPDPSHAGVEAARVLKPQGRLGLLVWHPQGSVGAYQQVAFRYIQIQSTAHDPFQWGDEAQARAWLMPFRDVLLTPIEVPFHAESPIAAWRILQQSTGRIAAAYATLDPATRARLDADMIDFFQSFRAPSGEIYWPREALVIRGIRR